MGSVSVIKSRPAAGDDLEFIYEVFMDPLSNSFLSYDMMDIKSFQTIYNDLVMQDELYICYDGDNKIGTYSIHARQYRQAHCWYMGAFALHNDAKGKGYSKLMLAHIIEKAKKAGKKRVELGVSSHNNVAIHLYKKFGFHIEGCIRKSYRINNRGRFYNEIIMGLLL